MAGETELLSQAGVAASGILVNAGWVLLSVVGAMILLVIGWVLGNIVKHITVRVLKSTKVDKWFDEQNLSDAIGGKEISVLTGSILKWYIIVLFLAAAAEIVRLKSLQAFLEGLQTYVPLVLGGIIVFIAGLLLARYARNSIESTKHKMKKVAGVLAEAIIVLFSGVLALTLALGENGPAYMDVIAEYLKIFIHPFIVAFAYMLAIVIGIQLLTTFGDDIKKIMADVKKSLK